MAEESFSVYADFVREQLAAEDSRRSSLEQRGLAVITSSGVLATLAFGALALAKQGDRIRLPGPSPFLLIVGAVILLLAAILALATNAPRGHRAINLGALKATLRKHQDDPEQTALVRVTATRLGLWDTTRQVNDVKALLCLGAMAAEVVGVALLGTTICLVILGSG
jgi:hypothetical protein